MRAALVLTALACLFNGGFVAWSVADLAAGVRIEMARRVAEANLEQAERKWMACHRGGFYTIGTAIFMCEARKSELTVAQVPEVREAGL